jgi:hypothetical protein
LTRTAGLGGMPGGGGKLVVILAQSLTGLALGLLVGLPTLALAVASAGAGHGDYSFARLLFPWTMLLTRAQGDVITRPLLTLALAQFPLYGALIGATLSSGRTRTITIVAIGLFHAIADAICFSGALPNFS